MRKGLIEKYIGESQDVPNALTNPGGEMSWTKADPTGPGEANYGDRIYKMLKNFVTTDGGHLKDDDLTAIHKAICKEIGG